MKKTMRYGIVLLAALVTAAPVAASDAEVSLGLKLWSSTWKETVNSGGTRRDLQNGTELMAGPALHARLWQDWFASAAYLVALGDYGSSDWYAPGDKMTFERADTELQAGYLLRDPYNELTVGFFAAYRTVDAPASYNGVDAGTWKLYGPGLGMRAEKRLQASTTLSGSLAYLFLEQEFAYSSGTVSRFDADGWSLEIAVAYAFTRSISADVGFKYERFKGNTVNGGYVTDSFSGLTAGIAYTF